MPVSLKTLAIWLQHTHPVRIFIPAKLRFWISHSTGCSRALRRLYFQSRIALYQITFLLATAIKRAKSHPSNWTRMPLMAMPPVFICPWCICVWTGHWKMGNSYTNSSGRRGRWKMILRKEGDYAGILSYLQSSWGTVGRYLELWWLCFIFELVQGNHFHKHGEMISSQVGCFILLSLLTFDSHQFLMRMILTALKISLGR